MWRRLIYHPEVNYALRQTLVLCLPVAVGLILGHLQQGLLFSLVPACCNIAGLDTPHKRFFKRLIVGGCLFAGCSLAVQLLLARDIPLPLILTVLAMTLGVTAEISSLHARLLPASLIAAIFTLSLAGNMPVWEPLLIYALGTLWYGLFNWFWFWLWREQPLRESLSLLYVQLADYCEAKYTLLTQHTDPGKILTAAADAPAEGGGSDKPVLSAAAYARRQQEPRIQTAAAHLPGGAGSAGAYLR
jgi:uncharacterized membrane protein YccC